MTKTQDENIEFDKFERKNGKLRLVKKNLVMFTIIFFLWSLVIPPSQADTIRAINDSFTFTENGGGTFGCKYNGIPCNTTNNYATHLNISVAYCGSDGVGGATNYGQEIYFKFPLNTTRIVQDFRVNVPLLNTVNDFIFDKETGNTKGFWFLNQTWGENFTNQSQPEGLRVKYTDSWVNFSTTGESVTESRNIFNPANTNRNVTFIKYIYNTIGNLSLQHERFFIADVGGACSTSVGIINTTRVTAQSHNGGANSGAFLNITFTDFLTDKIEMHDCPPSGSDINVWFDFESGNASCSFFPEADLQYDLTTNTLNGGQPKGTSISGDPAPLSTFNTLSNVNCFILGNANLYNNNPITGLNPVTPDGQVYSTVCFNLTGQHAGKQYYGSIKILNNTKTGGILDTKEDFDFYYALYSPSFAKFSTPLIVPNPPQLGVNTNISWSSTTSLTTVLRYQVNQTGTFGSVQTIQDTNFSQAHSIIIAGSVLVPGVYLFHYEGNSSTGSYFYSDNYTFTVGTNINITLTNSSIVQGANGLVNSGFVKTTLDAIYIFGFLMLFIATIGGFFYGGLELGIAAFTGADTMLVGAGLLPFYMVLPLILTAAFIITLILRRVFVGEGGQ